MNREEDVDAPRGHASSGESDSDGEERNEDDRQLQDGGDTVRIADSATEYARRCLLTGAFSKAMVALQSAVEIAEMPSTAYRQGVFQSAQVLRAAHEYEASITCMQTIYRHMPTPYTPDVGILIIAQLHDEMQRWDSGRFWRKRLGSLHGTTNVWLELGDQAFEQQDFVFAADFYAQSPVVEAAGLASCRAVYRYLFSLTQFTGPCAATHRQQRQLVAWRLAQRFRYDQAEYGDADYWRLRDLYAQSFPSIHRAVLDWDAVYAERIAQWWKTHCASSKAGDGDDEDGLRAQEAVRNQVSPREESKSRRKTTKRRQKREPAVEVAVSAVKMPVKTRLAPSRRGTQRDKVRDASMAGSGAVDLEVADASRARGSPCARLGASKSTPTYYEASPTKRKFGAVRRLRKQRLSDDVRPPSPTLDAPSDSTSQVASLLELYPLRNSSSDQTTGRKPGLAEMDMQELETFARLAHYRARVISAQHVEVSALAPERVKPRWLVDLDKAAGFLAGLRRSKPLQEDDSIAHISDIHARLVLQLTAIQRQYAAEYGATTFALQLQALVLQLAHWRFQRVAELVEALDATRSVAVDEEKRRNLEFYHVHRG